MSRAMPLSVGLLDEGAGPRAALLTAPLSARGDRVERWSAPAGASWAARAHAYAAALRALAGPARPDVLVVSGAPRSLGVLASAARLGGVALVLDVAVPPRGAGALDVVASVAATALVARDEGSYAALLRAGVPAYRVGLVGDPVAFEAAEARVKEPPVKGAVRAVIAAETPPPPYLLAAARAVEPKLVFTWAAPDAPPPPPELEVASPGQTAAALGAAHVALAVGEGAVARRAAGLAMAIGVPLLWAVDGAPHGIAGAERVTPAEAGARLGKVARDRGARAALTARGRAWDEELGWAAQARLWLRTVDQACAEKVAAERRARQAAIEGVKTGTRKE